MYYCCIGVGSPQWRDKVRNAETEVEKFKAAIADKIMKLHDLQKQVASYSEDISMKETKLDEALKLINKVLFFKFNLNLSNINTNVNICPPSCKWNLLECTILPYFQVSKVIIVFV